MCLSDQIASDMASKYVLIFLAIAQALAQTPLSATTLLAQRSSTSSASQSFSSSSSVSTGGGFGGVTVIALPTQELLASQARLQSNIQQLSASLNQAQATFAQQSSNWYLPSPDLRSTFEQSIAVISGLIQQAGSYAQGADKLLTVLQSAGSDIQLEWVERVRKLQSLTELSLIRAEDGIASTVRNCAEIAADQQVYAEAKNQQLIETKQQMDNTLQQLLEQTLQVGVQAGGVLQQALREWTVILRTQLGTSGSDSAIARLQEVAAQTLADLERLRPEDIEAAMSDAHRTIEDIKGLFYSSGISSNVVRQAVNPVQLGMFATLTRARNIHT